MKRPFARETVVVVEPRWKRATKSVTASNAKAGSVAALGTGVAAVAAAREKAGPVLVGARDKAGPALGTAREKAAPLVDVAKERTAAAVDVARERTSTAVDAARPHVESARDSVVAAARDSVLPAVHDSAVRAGEKAEEVAPRVVAAVSGAVSTALLASEPVRDEAMSRGTAAIAALKGEVVVPARKRSKLRRALSLFFLLGATGGAVFAWRRSQKSDPWTVPASSGPTGIAPKHAAPVPPVVAPVTTPVAPDVVPDVVSDSVGTSSFPTPESPVSTVAEDGITVSTPPADTLGSATVDDAILQGGSKKVHGDVFEVTDDEGKQV